MTDYALLADQAASMIETEPHYVAALSNLSALIYESMDRLNWAGFYMMDKGSPFSGTARLYPDRDRKGCLRYCCKGEKDSAGGGRPCLSGAHCL